MHYSQTTKANMDVVAKTLFASTDDMPAAVEALQAHLPRDAWYALCESMELCPLHACDIEICNDDDDVICRDYRHSL